MNVNPRWSRLGAFILLTALCAIVFYLVILVIFRFEDAASGIVTAFDLPAILREAFTQHWYSLLLWSIGLVLIALWQRGVWVRSRDREELLKKILETVADAIYLVDRDGRITFANAAAERILGLSRDHIAHHTYNDAMWTITTADGVPFPEEDQPFARIMKTGKPVSNVEQSILKPDGSRLVLSINAAPLRNADGEIIGEVGAMTDITARRKAEQEIVQRNKELSILNEIGLAFSKLIEPSAIFELIYTMIGRVIDSSNFLIAVYDDANQHLYYPVFVKNGERLKPYTRPFANSITEYVIQTKRPLLITHDAWKHCEELGIQPQLKTPLAKSFVNVPILAGDKVLGAIMLQDYENEYVYNPQHVELLSTFAAQAAVAIENARLLDQVRQSENKYHGIFENAVVGIYQTSREGKWLTANPTLARMLGYDSPAELMERMTDLNRQFYVDPGRRDEFAWQLEDNEGIANFESQIYRGDGSVIWISENARAIRDAENRFDGFEGTIIDITDRKQAEQLKNEFVSVVSHELRTPLTSIRGSLGLIAGGAAGAISPQAKTLVDIAHKNSERLVRLINDILDVEKIESGKVVFNIKPIQLMPLLEQSLEANCSFGHQFGVEFALEREIPGVRVQADPDRLMQVITNLLSNAAKFSPRGSAVAVAVSRRDSFVRVAIQDRGPGIPAEFQNRIFQKFAQADSSDARQKGGTGLGLNISKAIVERLGGEIGFETAPNAGTTFYFDLPEWRDEPAAPPAFAPPKPRVLVCEDDPDTAAFLRLLLEQGGFVSDVAYSATQAKERLQQNHYAGMTLDLVLPDQDGVALIRELRADPATRELPIVVSMRADQARHELNGDAIRIIDWIPKPIDTARLIAAVRCAAMRQSSQLPRILHVDDDPDIVEVTSVILRDYVLDRANTIRQAKERLRAGRYDLVILDLEMPDGSGTDLLPFLREQNLSVPVVIFSVEEIRKETAEQVAAALVKSRTSSEKLVETIRALIQPHAELNAMRAA